MMPKELPLYSSTYDLRDASRPIDVHRWSEWPEVNHFLNDIYSSIFNSTTDQLSKIQKKHVKILLLDLYVAWRQGWKYVGMSFDVNRYKPKSRYNALHISKTLILVARKLEQAGLIIIHKGYHNHATGEGYVTRLQPSEGLLAWFTNASWADEAIDCHWQRELVELRDNRKDKVKGKKISGSATQIRVEYDDTPETIRMRQILTAYNTLLQGVHIDCCHLTEPFIYRKDGAVIRIGQHDRYIKRVFNNGKFNKGGRFYGGFWQQIPSRDREHVRINGQRTVEIDYNALHVVLLYARRGLDYWDCSGGTDPYAVQVDGLTTDAARQLGKLLFLIAINANNEESAYKALRKTVQDNHSLEFPLALTDSVLSNVLVQLRQRHTLIADSLCSGVGIDLQFLDSQITEALIEYFTDSNIPILTIHDSYIVPHDYAIDLRDAMTRVFLCHVQPADNQTYHSMDWDNIAQHTVAFKQIGYDDQLLDDLDYAPDADNAAVFQRHEAAINEIDTYAVQGYWDRLDSFQKQHSRLPR